MAEASFSGLPWQTVVPANVNLIKDIAGGVSQYSDLLNPRPLQEMAPAAAGMIGEGQGIIGQLQRAGSGAIGAAQAGAGQIQGYANQLAQMGQGVFGEFAYNDPYAQQALKQGFDPLNQQRAYYQQQLAGQLGAQAGQAGYAGTPYAGEVSGAGLAAFQNQWELQRLQRQQTAAQTAATLQGQELAAQQLGGQLINEAGQLDTGALAQLMQAYGLQGQNLAAAMQGVVGLLNAMKITTSVGSGGGGGGGGGAGPGLGGSEAEAGQYFATAGGSAG